MNNEKTNLIVEYVLTSEENLRLSSQVVRAFDDVIKRLVKDFLEQLEKELMLTLGDEWIIQNDLKDDVFSRSGFSISKKKWKDLYSIGFFAETTGLRNFDFYVWRNIEVISSPNNLINQLINENYKKGNVYRRGDWWQYVDNHYRNWTDEETLTKLYEKNEMVNYFKDQLIKIKCIIESTIDNEIKKYI
jgi:hypothetical protein